MRTIKEVNPNSAHFRKKILSWNALQNTRKMPWKGQKDPYKIWLSEIILQQTRVEQGWDYYLRFLKKYPDINKLAKAPEQEVFKLWEGLGYYSRCKNLIETAGVVSEKYKGKFPGNYEEILSLKGIGIYTAAAISSFAFNLPHAVVDGNVLRVLSRYFGKKNPIDSGNGKKFFSQLASECLDKNEPGIYNQAIMDFGAVICKPNNPECKTCTLRKSCAAFNKGLVEKLPVKQKKLQRKTRWFAFYVLNSGGKLFIRKRNEKDIWLNLYEFPSFEFKDESDLIDPKKIKKVFKNVISVDTVSKIYSQILSHQTIKAVFLSARLNKLDDLAEEFIPVSIGDIGKYPFPKIINEFLRDNHLASRQR